MNKILEILLSKIIKQYLKDNLKVFVTREGYNEEFLMVSIVLDGEEIDSDSVRGWWR